MYRPLPNAASRVDEISRFLTDVTLVVMRVDAGAPAADRPLATTRFRERSGTTIVAIQRAGGGLVRTPSGDDILSSGDTVLIMGTTDQLERAGALLRRRTPA